MAVPEDNLAPTYVPVANGAKLALHCLTPVSERHKPPVLFVHAAGFGARTYGPFTQRLAERFTVWAPDLRGHGWSETPSDGDYVWTTTANDMLAIVDYLADRDEIDRTQLNCVGHSVGAAVLLLAEIQRPGLIANIYGYEPVVWRTKDVLERDENPLVAGALKRRETFDSRAEAMHRFASRPPFSLLRADALHSYMQDGFEDLPDGTVRLRCRAADEAGTYRGDYVSTEDRIAGCEVSAVIGKGDAYINQEQAQDIGIPAHEALPNSRLIIYPGLGHFGLMQDPDRVAEDVVSALEPSPH